MDLPSTKGLLEMLYVYAMDGVQQTCPLTASVAIHALKCPRGGYPSIRHNEIRDITAELMSDVCHGVGTEPCLQPVVDEHLTHRTAREDGARLDIVAESF